MSIIPLPLSENLSPQEMLASAAHRPFDDVLILGRYDGKLRHASTMTIAHQLHILECYKLILLGVVDEVGIDTE